jgi:hypothetical protein
MFKCKGKMLLYLFESDNFPQREIKVFGKTIVRNIAFLDGCAAFESKEIGEGGC